VGSSALPAGGHLVHGDAPGRLVRRAAPGSRRCKSAKPVRVACAPCPGRTTDGRRSSRRAARALGRAQLTREGRRAPLSNRLRTALGCRCPFTLYAGFALRRGLSATPRSPMGSRKNLSDAGCFPACLELPNMIRVPDGCKTPKRGLKTRGSLVPLVVMVRARLPVRRRGAPYRAGQPSLPRPQSQREIGRARVVGEAPRSVHAACCRELPSDKASARVLELTGCSKRRHAASLAPTRVDRTKAQVSLAVCRTPRVLG
jgi:hypothetical protein